MRFDQIVRTPTLGKIDFRIHDVSLCIVNAARRAMMADVQCAAFNYDICVPDVAGNGITVISNSTTLHNEMLAHRLSFIPIHLNENEQEKFRGNPTRFNFSLRVKNKGAAGAALIDVTSADIRVTDELGIAVSDAARAAMFPPDRITGDHVLLVCLRPSPTGDGMGEEISIDAIATSSSGSANCRWSPVSLCTFRNVVDDSIASATFLQNNADREATSSPAQSRAQFNTLDAHRCFAKDKHGDPFMFDISIESVCGLRPEYIFFKSLRILSSKIEKLVHAIKEIDESAYSIQSSVKIEALPNTDDFYAMTIAGEGHTLGNLIQGILYETHVRDNNSRQLSFVGYHVAHPLDQAICMKFKVIPGLNIRDFLVESLLDVVSRLDTVALEWTHPSGLDLAGIQEINAFLANIPAVVT